MPVPGSVERALDNALDRALAIQRPAVVAYVERVRTRYPTATPADVIAQLERRYLTAVVGTGAASGGAAALPGVGTATSVAAGAAEIAAFVGATALYVLAVAEVHGVPIADPQIRRALVLTVLLGEAAEPTVEAAAGGAAHWAQVLGRSTNKEAVGGVNAQLAKLLVGRFGARQGALLLGRAIPLGIGAGIGAAGNAALARASINTSRRAFGPPPKRFGARVIDSEPRAITGASGVPSRLRNVYSRARQGRKAP
ncbi:MAG: hypothetical protein JWQ77_839 [Jatrophihabitans sp.]|nr:hypothetical protein [Jatrophihabitans sp.]